MFFDYSNIESKKISPYHEILGFLNHFKFNYLDEKGKYNPVYLLPLLKARLFSELE